MTNRECCIGRRKAEMQEFVSVLKAVHQGRLDYRPEPKARSAAALAWLLATEEAALVSLLDSGSVSWKEDAPPASIDAIVAAFERSAAAVDERLGRLDEAGWEKKVRFLLEGAPPWGDTLGQFFWGFLFDALHHRRQLSTYLRPVAIKMPSLHC